MRTVRIVLVSALVSAASGCKSTSDGSGLRDDVAAPVTTSVMGPLHRELWAVRMGMTLQGATQGLQVTAVEPARFAHAIGLVPGDVIQALNGRPVRSPADFEAVALAFASRAPGTASWDAVWDFRVLRAGAPLTVRNEATFDCDPVVLAGCGPLRP